MNDHALLPSRPEVLERARAALDRNGLVGLETIPTEQAAGRVTARAVRARCPSPTAHVSTRDGWAVEAALLAQASPENPVLLAIGTDCSQVNTGWALPSEAHGVVPLEEAAPQEDGRLAVTAPIRPGQHVRPRGEDIRTGDVVLGPDTLVGPAQVGALLTAGVFELPVYERVRVTFLSTGDEILPLAERGLPRPGQVVESNAPAYCALARQWDAQVEFAPPVPDDGEALARAVRAALDSGAHVVAVGGGSCNSDKDYSYRIFDSLGRVLSDGVAMVPGRPGILALAEGRLLAGVPGNPAGGLGFMEEIVGPLVRWLGRRPEPRRAALPAVMACDVTGRTGVERLVRVGLGRAGPDDSGNTICAAAPLDKLTGLVRSLGRAPGLVRVPPESRGLTAGQAVSVELFDPAFDPASGPSRGLVVVGDWSPRLETLSDELLAAGDGFSLFYGRAKPDRARDSLARGWALAAAQKAGLDFLTDQPCLSVPLDGDTVLHIPELYRDDPRVVALLSLIINTKP